MPHYICKGGCGAVSETAGVCEANGCPGYQNELIQCDCEDGNHEKVLKGE
ncbi:MAG: hypothetical protein WC459_02535 [Patescibacteria group bacterium]